MTLTREEKIAKLMILQNLLRNAKIYNDGAKMEYLYQSEINVAKNGVKIGNNEVLDDKDNKQHNIRL
jgi:hypothetical protein